MTPLELHAESFAPSGGMAAEGMLKLLGAPALSLLQTVIREAVQNSWDACIPGQQLEFHIALRHLEYGERQELRDTVFKELPLAPSSAQPLRRFLSRDRPLVMELSDWGARGLGGPSRANQVPDDGETNNFVNFVRNMGAPRDMLGGGTYGYGKSSLYQFSRCSTVIVNSVSATDSMPAVRRLIGCHFGASHDASKSMRLTGRHWWGRWDEEGLVEPITGKEAQSLSDKLGIPTRTDEQSGTTLMILDPDLEGCTLEDVSGELQETLLWYLWPKMLDDGHGPAIRFVLEIDGEAIDIPRPEEFPPLDLFVEAYRALKTPGSDISEIRSERPARLLGHCAIRKGFRGSRTLLTDEEETIIPAACCHIALMRPVELVVKYIEGTALPGEEHEWAGVFICSRQKEVASAFAAAEPPAHDDWIPTQMPKGWSKTFVKVALDRLTQLARTYAYPDLETSAPTSDQPSFARAADRLGELLPIGKPDLGRETDDGSRGKSSGGAGSRRSTRWRVSEPSFIALEEGDSGTEAVFRIDVTNGERGELHLTALPAAIIDGSLASAEDSGVVIPVVRWEDADGRALQKESTLIVPAGETDSYRVRVLVPAETAVGLRVEVVH